jgi:DNA-binding PadR family transcriptional regulator
MPIVGYDELPERSQLVLTSLAGGNKHGYALMQDIEEFTGLRLGPGTLYGTLSRLEAEGFIAPLPDDDRRRPYRLTGAGAEALEVQLSANQDLARLGLKRIGATSS